MKSVSTRNLAFTAIALLAFTGCGAQATGSVPEPDSSTSTAAAAAASGSASASEETASAEETNYSGGSKAPEGEYRAADEHGPAQNVPKPVAPEGMNVESTEAMLLFIDYWNDMRNYANQTGDVSIIRTLVTDSFQQEKDFYEALEEIYSSGGWVIGGDSTVNYNRSLITNHGDGAYSIGSNIVVNDSVLWYNGEATYSDNSESSYQGVELQLQYSVGGWKISGAKKVGE